MGADSRLSPADARALHTKIFFVYMASMFAVTFPVPSIGVIQASLGLTTGQVAGLGAAQTLGVAFGKVLSGWVVDSLGARRTLTVGFLAVFVSAAGLCIANSPQQLSAALFMVRLGNAVVWPCFSVLIGRFFQSDPQQLDTGFWILSLSSRIWGTASIAFFAALLRVYDWRAVGSIAAAFALLGAVLTQQFIHDTPTQVSVPVRRITLASTLTSTGTFLSTSTFWLVVIAHTFSATVRRAEGILAPFLADTTDLTEEQAGMATIVFSIGYVSGLLVAGPAYNRSAPATKITIVQGLYGVCLASLVLLAALSGQGQWTGVAGQAAKGSLLGLLSFTTALQYFIVPFVYATQVGGENTGVLTSLIDAFGVGVATLFFVVAGHVVDGEWGWRGVWAILLGLGVVGATTMTWFLHSFVGQAKPKNKRQ